MSELRQALLDAIGEGPATTDDLVEATGYERRQVAVELQHMGGEGLVRSGRGGWRPIDPTAPPPIADAPSVRVHHQRAPAAAPDDPPLRRKPGRRPKAATVRELASGKLTPRDQVAIAYPLTREARYIFGITERGELMLTDIKDYSKTAHFSAHDTARLLDVLERWRPMLQRLQEVA